MVIHHPGIMGLMRWFNLVLLHLNNTMKALVHIKTSYNLKHEIHENMSTDHAWNACFMHFWSSRTIKSYPITPQGLIRTAGLLWKWLPLWFEDCPSFDIFLEFWKGFLCKGFSFPPLSEIIGIYNDEIRLNKWAWTLVRKALILSYLILNLNK